MGDRGDGSGRRARAAALAAEPAPVRPPVAVLDGLTSLRFVAAMLVVLTHAVGLHGVIPSLRLVSYLGFVGVDFFFVLSGFVLTWSHRPQLSRRDFYRNRFARIYPLYLTGLAIALPVSLYEGTTYPLAAWVCCVLLVQAWVPTESYAWAANRVSWSLSCEFLFYAAFPLLHRRIARLDRRRLWQLGLATVAAIDLAVLAARIVDPPFDGPTQPGLLFTQPVFRLAEFVLGICLGRLVLLGWRLRMRARTLLLAGAGGYALATLVINIPVRLRPATPYTTIVAVREYATVLIVPVVVVLLAAVATAEIEGRLPRLLAHRWAVRLGEWSFALYIVHTLILRVMETATPVPASQAGRIAWVSIAVVLSVAASGALHHGVELPLLRRLKAPSRRPAAHPDAVARPVGAPLA